MRMLTVLGLLAAGVVLAPAFAEEKEKAKDKPLSGSFTRKAGELDLKMVFKKDNIMEFHVTTGDVGCVMTSRYTKEKDGTIKCEITNFEKKGEFPVTKEKGYKFSFKVEMKDKKLVMSDLNGDDIDDNAKQAIQGDYEAKTD